MNQSKPLFSQCGIMTKEYMNILLSDKKNLAVMLMFPVIAIIITIGIAGENMFIYSEDTKSACFVLVSSAIWGGLFNSIQVVVKERANIKRDFVNGVNPLAYTFSRVVLQFFVCLLQSVIFLMAFLGVSIIYGNDLPEAGLIFGNSLIEYFVSILLLTFAADMMGYCISCFVKKTETASVLSPYILIAQLIFSGVLFSLKGVGDIISNFMISRWGMEALGSTSKLNEIMLKIQTTFPDFPHEENMFFEATGTHLLKVWAILLMFSFIFVVIGNVLLLRVSKDKRM